MNFNLNNTTYSVRFYYENAENPQDENPLESVTHKRVKTTCKITEKLAPGDYKILSVGDSANHSKDLFTKDTGRKLAMAKALQQFTQDRNVRKEFWLNYFNNHKEGKKLVLAGKV